MNSIVELMFINQLLLFFIIYLGNNALSFDHLVCFQFSVRFLLQFDINYYEEALFPMGDLQP